MWVSPGRGGGKFHKDILLGVFFLSFFLSTLSLQDVFPLKNIYIFQKQKGRRREDEKIRATQKTDQDRKDTQRPSSPTGKRQARNCRSSPGASPSANRGTGTPRERGDRSVKVHQGSTPPSLPALSRLRGASPAGAIGLWEPPRTPPFLEGLAARAAGDGAGGVGRPGRAGGARGNRVPAGPRRAALAAAIQSSRKHLPKKPSFFRTTSV